jgi:hypothetical protein
MPIIPIIKDKKSEITLTIRYLSKVLVGDVDDQ